MATSLNNLAVLCLLQGRYGEAEPLYQEALTIYREQLGDRHPLVATSLNNLAAVYEAQGRYGEAELLYQEALTIRREQLGDSHIEVAQSLNNLALLYQRQGRYGEAEPLNQEALTIYREQLGDRHPDVAISLNNLAELYRLQGHYGEAEPLFQDSLTILREQLGDRHPLVANSLNNLAGLYQLQGRYGETELLYQEALAIRREQLGDRHPDVAQSLNNLAELYRLQGRYGEAESLYQESLGIFREQLGDRHPVVATSLNNLALLYQIQGRYGEAEIRHQEALSISREQLGDRHPDVATSLNNLAALYGTRGRYGEAEPLFQEALSILREQLGDRHPNVATSLNNLARLYEVQGRYGEAIDFLEAGLEVQEWNLDLNLATLPEVQRQAYATTISGDTDATLSLDFNANTVASNQLALITLLRRKGRLLDAGTSSGQRLRQNLTPNDQATLDQLTDIQRQLATLTFNPPDNLPPDQYRARLAELEAEANQLETTLARRSAAFRVETQPVDLAAVQAQIPTNGVLVEFAQYRPFNRQDPTNRQGEPRYAAYLLFPDGTIQAIDLGEAAPIDRAIQAYVDLLQDRRANPRSPATLNVEITPDFVEDVTTTLRALVLDPIAPHIQGRQHLLISPDSQLNRLPFETLLTTNGEYLIEQYQISYLNSGRDLLRFGVLPPSTAPAVVLANPDYNTAVAPGATQVAHSPSTPLRDRATDLSQLQVEPLPGTAAEVSAIAPLLPNPTILTEANATETALKQAQQPSILHIATHGFFLANAPRPEPADSRTLALGGDGSRAFAFASTPIENPLLRSGLALAGFNRRTSGGEDGVFTALEASQLNLTGTQLVVLSACDTALGEINNGEGVYGLRRAFALAGAETQLLSLWQVDDYGTQSLMARYYKKLMAGAGRSDALRQVQLEMLNEGGDYAHPYYWAAFVLAGNWHPLE